MLKWLRRQGADYQAVFSGEPGKRVLADLRQRCGYQRNNFNVARGSDSYLAYLEGRRSVYQEIDALVQADDTELEELTRQLNRERVSVYD